MRKIGITLHAKRGLELPAYLKKVKELGFDCVFSGVPAPEKRRAMADAVREAGLEYETLHAPFDGINGIWLEGEAGDLMRKRLLDSVEACVEMGAPITVVHLSSGLKPPSITDVGRARFAELVEYAGQKGICVAFENQRMLGNIAWAFEAFADCPHVGFCYDTGHEGCFTPGRQYMPLFGGKLICTHIHDNSGEFDRDEHCIPFDGKLDFDRIVRQIRESGYTGSLMLEAIARNSHYYDDMPVEEYLEKCAVAVKRLRDMVDG